MYASVWIMQNTIHTRHSVVNTYRQIWIRPKQIYMQSNFLVWSDCSEQTGSVGSVTRPGRSCGGQPCGGTANPAVGQPTLRWDSQPCAGTATLRLERQPCAGTANPAVGQPTLRWDSHSCGWTANPAVREPTLRWDSQSSASYNCVDWDGTKARCIDQKLGTPPGPGSSNPSPVHHRSTGGKTGGREKDTSLLAFIIFDFFSNEDSN